MEPDDAATLYAWENDPATWECSDRQWPLSKTDIGRFIEQSDLDVWQSRQIRFMIDSAEGATVGCIDIFDFDPLNAHCSLGILIDAAHRRRGFAHSAIEGALRFAYRTMRVETVEVTMATDNEASQRLFAKAGFTQSGIRPRWIRRGDNYVDEVLMHRHRE